MKKKLSKAEQRRIKRLEKNVSPTAQHTLHYKALFENGLMHVTGQRYSQTFKLGELNYTTATEDEQSNIATKYNDAINSLSEKETFQLTLIVSKRTKAEYLKEQAYDLQGDQFDVLRNEENELIEDAYEKGRNNYKIMRFITLSTEAEDLESARRRLENISEPFAQEMLEIDATFEPLDGLERMQVLSEILRPNVPLYGDFDDIRLSNLTTKDLVAPQFIDFSKSNVDFEIENRLCKDIYLRDFPRKLSDIMFKDLTATEQEMVITIHAKPYSISETNTRLRNQATDVEAEAIRREKKALENNSSPQYIARTTKENQNDVEKTIEFVSKTGDKQQLSTFIVHFSGKTREELHQNEAKINGVADKFGAVFAPLYMVQEEALNSTLPLGENFVDIEKNYVRDLITPNIAINSPFTSADVQHKNGKLYGINSLSKNNILINRKDDSLDNGNMGIVGPSGTGKSVTAKNEIISTLLKNPKDEVIVVDPEREYLPLAEYFGGEVVKIAPGSPSTINILDLPEESGLFSDDDPIANKSDFLLSLFTSLFHTVSEEQETIIDEVTTTTYDRFKVQGKTPNLRDWYDVLQENDDPEAVELAKKLKLYVTGSLNMFSGTTNINLKNRFTIYDIYNLKNKFKPFGFMTVLDRIWNKVVENKLKGITTWVYLDEFHLLIDSNQVPVLRQKAEEIWARIRKYGGFPTFMTQSTERMLQTPEGRSVFLNSDVLILLRHKKKDVRKLLVQEFGLTEKQENYLRTAPKGGGVIVAGSSAIPFSNTIPSYTQLYALMNTKA
ncbi:VirB4-like conjugal transfer ATPase, CD1110 family [Lactococcus garvieae]|nr:DUF87 domain-containing protein [Lactococcus garvieae]